MKLGEIAEKHGDKFFEVVEVELRKLAAEQPDFRYKTVNGSGSCRYNGPCRASKRDSAGKWADAELLGSDCSGCIFGQALQRLGWDDERELKVVAGIIDVLTGFVGIEAIENRTLKWSTVQLLQDTGSTWAEAVAALDEEIQQVEVVDYESP